MSTRQEQEDEAGVIRYLNCKKCMHSVPLGQSIQSYARLEVAETERGYLLRCVRHDLKVVHIDLLGQKIQMS